MARNREGRGSSAASGRQKGKELMGGPRRPEVEVASVTSAHFLLSRDIVT